MSTENDLKISARAFLPAAVIFMIATMVLTGGVAVNLAVWGGKPFLWEVWAVGSLVFGLLLATVWVWRHHRQKPLLVRSVKWTLFVLAFLAIAALSPAAAPLWDTGPLGLYFLSWLFGSAALGLGFAAFLDWLMPTNSGDI